MIITCLGHSKFKLQLNNGLSLVTDPFDASTGYPVTRCSADVTLVSHAHHDHSAIETMEKTGEVIRTAGTYTIRDDVKVTAVPSFHDDLQGNKRGSNLMFLIEAEGLRIAHLGDLGHLLTPDQVAALGRVDLLMIPVGGFYTINAEQAIAVCRQLSPRVILPMHYKTEYNKDWPIATQTEFLSLLGERAEYLNLLRVTREDLKCQPAVAILNAQC